MTVNYNSVTWKVPDIITKVRNVTGSPSTDQLSDQAIVDYINRYYAFTMPFELKEQINQQPYNFTTVALQDVYQVLSTFTTDEPMAYANGFPLVFYQDRDVFFQDWPQQYTQDQVATSTGTPGPYSGNSQAFPIIMGTYFITDGTQVAYDQSDGILYQNNTGGTPVAVGTINYQTGAFTVTFLNNSPNGNVVYDNYQAYQPARPQGVLFYNNEFTFRPVPDQVYQITMQGFITQQQLITSISAPLQIEWGELLAIGAALDIFLDRGDLGSYNTYYPMLKRYENVALGRYVEQMQNQQSIPRF
jgi:hypothetical protein